MGRIIRWLLIGLGVILGALALFAVERFTTLRGSLPALEGEIQAPGLTEPLQIVRDAHAVPHIYASSLEETFYGLGYAHAQDRLWQMTFLRRLGQGRLSEVAGSLALEADRNIRALGLTLVAGETFAVLDDRAKAVLEAYAKGVNAVIGSRDRPLPPEFFLTQTTPEPWRAEDSLLLFNMLSLGLTTNAFAEIARLELWTLLPRDRIAEAMAPDPGLPEGFDPSAFIAPEDSDTAQAEEDRGKHFAEALLSVSRASNNWVADERWTATGGALLANDPHLGLMMPGIWYMAHLSAEDRNIVGATIPGIPAVLLGRTDDVSWGFTNTGADVQDLVLERIDPENPEAYLTPDGSEAFKTRREHFEVRFGSEQTDIVRQTRHGPILPILSERAPEGHVYALRWTALDPDNKTFETSLAILEAGTVAEAREALRDYAAPMQNIVLADTEGGIGFVAPARVPIRSTGEGLVPVKGWEIDQLWTGFIPFEDLPTTGDLERGFIVTANHDITEEDYPYLISREWPEPYRAERIEDLLTIRSNHDLASFAAIQMDSKTGLHSVLLPRMTGIEPETPEARNALARLEAWDGDMATDKAEPLIFAAWLRAFTRALAEDDLGERFGEFWSVRPVFVANVLDDVDGQSRWCDRLDTLATETCADLLDLSLEEALADLKDRYGKTTRDWRWGAAHKAAHGHLPFGFIPVLRGLFSRSVESAGGTYAVNRGSYRFASDEPFANVHAGGYRAVYDMADPERSVYMIATGQSGNPYSPYYDNLAEPWARGEFITIPTDRAVLDQTAIGTLRLTPALQEPQSSAQ